jgi:Fur family transcriptional regulator, peroxide stress response regulator
MEALIKKLRSHGIAVTPQRLAILASLRRRHDHPSAEQIYQEVQPQLPAISFNTVYKTLEVFCRKGLILKVNPLHETARYDGETGRHTHLVCHRCHTIADLHRQPEVPAHLDHKDESCGRNSGLPRRISIPQPLGALSQMPGAARPPGNLRLTGVGGGNLACKQPRP